MDGDLSALRGSPPKLAPTPTHNSSLPFRRGGFASLCEALDYAARGETGLNFFEARGRLTGSLPYRDLQKQAQTFARRLIGAGIARGERLLIIADTWPGFCVAFFGAQYAGVLPVPVAVPVGLGAKASYIEQLSRQIAASGAIGVVAPDELAAYAVTAAQGTTARIAGSMATFEALPEPAVELRPLLATEQCYVQFSSGSTRAPMGIDIRQDRLMANIDGSITRQELNEDDSGVSWLPLY
ncbi:MAG: AMP-binding protein, partial [Reyranella sp.]|nr:AMP-binding protein [Reyranella sp.]